MSISKREDQSVGFEVEIQNLQLCQGPTQNKVLLAQSSQTRNEKPAFSLVTDGAGGANTVYIEVVSAPMTTQDDILDYFETIRCICSIGKKMEKHPCRTTLLRRLLWNIPKRRIITNSLFRVPKFFPATTTSILQSPSTQSVV